MTVEELVQLLQYHPLDTRVVVCGYDDLASEQLQTVKITLNTRTRAT